MRSINVSHKRHYEDSKSTSPQPERCKELVKNLEVFLMSDLVLLSIQREDQT